MLSPNCGRNITCPWDLLWIQQHSWNFRLGCLILFQLQSNVRLQMTVKDFLLSWQPNLHTIFSTVAVQTENMHLAVLPLFQTGMQELFMPWYTQNLQLPWKTNGTLGQVDSSLNIVISLKVPKSTRSEDPFFFPVLFSLLHVYEMLARPTLGLFPIENVFKLRAPLHCTAVHNFTENASLYLWETCFMSCPVQMLLSCTILCDILRISR